MLATAQEALLTTPAAPGEIPTRVMQSTSKIIPLEHLHPSPTNPRRSFPAQSLADLADTIRRHGVLQPILVRPWPPGYQSINATAHYEIVAGERRYRAARLADLPAIPATIRTLTDTDVLEIQTIENLQREDVHPLEEAEGYQVLMLRTHYSAEDIAHKLGKSKAYIYARLKLCAITGEAREAFLRGDISASIALLIARIPIPAIQQKAAQEVIHGEYRNGAMSARQAAEHIQRHYMLRLADAPFPRGDAKLVEGVPTCHKCPKRTGNAPELYSDVKGADVCTDPQCFALKKAAHKDRQAAQAEAAGQKVITGKEAAKIAPYGVSDHCNLQAGFAPLDKQVWEAPVNGKGQHPTWRELLGPDYQAPAVIEDTRRGVLAEIAPEKDLIAAAAAKGIEIKQSRSSGDIDREREKQAKAETAYRTLLLDRIMASSAGEPFLDPDLIDIAVSMFGRLHFETQKLVCTTWNEEKKATREDVGRLEIEIPEMLPSDARSFIRLMSLISMVPVSSWQEHPEKTPDRLLAAADRWGIDWTVVKKQAATLAPKRAKKEPKK